MKTQTRKDKINQEIKSTEKYLINLKNDLAIEESKQEILIIEGFEITKPKICKNYEEAEKCPKGFRLPHRWELFKILESMENRKKLSDGGCMFFWSDLVENGYVRGLYLYGGLNLDSDGRYLSCSIDVGRVVFVKEMEK